MTKRDEPDEKEGTRQERPCPFPVGAEIRHRGRARQRLVSGCRSTR